MIVTSVAVLFIILYASYWWPRRYLWLHSWNLPGPTCLPLIGNLAMFSSNHAVNFKIIHRLHKSHKSFFRLWLGPHLYVMISDPEVIAKVFGNPLVQDHDSKFDRMMKYFIGNGLFAISGDKWKLHRKLVAPAFHRNILKSYVETFAAKSSVLAKDFCEVADGRTVSVYEYFGLCTLNSITETVIGIESNSQQTTDYTKICRGSELTLRRLMQPWLHIDRIYKMTADGNEADSLVKILHELCDKAVAEKRDAYRRGIKRSGIVTPGGRKINSFLDMMIDASESQGSPLSVDDLRDEVSALILAGTETTALTMSFLTILIAIHKDVQDDIHEELDSIFGDSQRPVVAEDLDKMFVLERAIKETMRLFPGIIFQPRLVPEDIYIGKGMVLPKNAIAVVDAFALHRNEKFYKDAHSFCPDRWLQNTSYGEVHPYAYLPFSSGQRTCLGRHLAMMEMKCTLSSVLRRVQISTLITFEELTSNIVIGLNIGLSSDIGYKVQMYTRTPTVPGCLL